MRATGICCLHRYNNKLQGTLPDEWHTMQPTLIDLHGNQLQVRPGQRSRASNLHLCCPVHGLMALQELHPCKPGLQLDTTLYSILVLLAGFTAIELGK